MKKQVKKITGVASLLQSALRSWDKSFGPSSYCFNIYIFTKAILYQNGNTGNIKILLCECLGKNISLYFAGAQNDLEKVQRLAYSQIKSWGMGESVGLLSFNSNPSEDYQYKPFSKRLQSLIDAVSCDFYFWMFWCSLLLGLWGNHWGRDFLSIIKCCPR